jgi:hypothetical protein
MPRRIDRSDRREDPAVLVVSGHLQGQHVHTLTDLLQRELELWRSTPRTSCWWIARRVTLLSLSERKEIELRNCPASVREWVTREKARIESGRSDLHAGAGGDVENE